MHVDMILSSLEDLKHVDFSFSACSHVPRVIGALFIQAVMLKGNGSESEVSEPYSLIFFSESNGYMKIRHGNNLKHFNSPSSTNLNSYDRFSSENNGNFCRCRIKLS